MTVRKITLGGTEHEFKPLNLGQMKAVGIGTAKQQRATPDPVAQESNWYEGTFDILAAALGMKVADVEKIEGATLDELLAANRTILDACGLIKAKEAAAGAPGPGGAPGAAG